MKPGSSASDRRAWSLGSMSRAASPSAPCRIGPSPPHHEPQAVGEPAAGDLPLTELDLVEHRFELLAGRPVAGDVVEHGEDEGLERVRVLHLAPLDPAGEGRLAGAVVEAGELRRRGAELRGLECAAKRRPAVLQQDPGQQLGAHGLVRVPRAAEQPAHQVVGAGRGLRLVGGVAVERLPGLGIAPLVRDRHVDLPALEAPEGKALERLLAPRRGDVAVGHQHRVGRMVLAGVEVAEHLPGERRDLGGVAAAVVVVGDGGKEQRLEPLPDLGRRRAHRSLHLVVDHALGRPARSRGRPGAARSIRCPSWAKSIRSSRGKKAASR